MAAQSPASVKLISAYNAAVAEGKVLDVSALQVDGTGARRIKIPKTTRGTKKWVGDVPIVSDNYNSYALSCCANLDHMLSLSDLISLFDFLLTLLLLRFDLNLSNAVLLPSFLAILINASPFIVK